MSNLTELWNKGKLPEGDYYIKRRNGYLPYDNIDSHGIWRNTIDEDIIEVLAEVPSYEEYQRLNWYAGNGVEENQELKMENAQLKTEYEKECHRADELEDSYWKAEKENAQLKDLLKRCYSFIDWCELGVPVAQRPILMKDINKALGEDK